MILRASIVSEDETLAFSKQNGTVLSDTITKSNSGNERASDPEIRLAIVADNVTEFNCSVVFEIIRHEDEVVGYESVPMTEWTTVSDEWVKDANSDIVYPEDIVKPKYTLAAFKSIINKINRADSFLERGRYILDSIVYLTDYDKEYAAVVAAVAEYKALVDEYNRQAQELNRAFEELFFSCFPGRQE